MDHKAGVSKELYGDSRNFTEEAHKRRLKSEAAACKCKPEANSVGSVAFAPIMRDLRSIIPTSAERNFTRKQEGNTVDARKMKNYSEASCLLTTSRGHKDPRIVRVSNGSGGKDRHSKVCTVRGLRDRRVRLSVPTAIQLYDLQDRLGLNQPSKVVDWLLDAAKHEIDELPPLQMPPNFGQYHHHHQQFQTNLGVMNEGFKINSSMHWDDDPILGLSRSNSWVLDDNLRLNSKEFATQTRQRNEEDQKQGSLDEGNGGDISSNNFFARPSHSFIPDLLSNVMPSNSFDRWTSPNFSSSHLGSHGFEPQTEDLLNIINAAAPFPSSTLSLASGSYFNNSHPGTSVDQFDDPKQINQFQMLSSSSQNPLSSTNSLLAPTFYSI
ncbi:hypothetical protein U1Q18_038930 [Sarracenia purpurea var. burkii]